MRPSQLKQKWLICLLLLGFLLPKAQAQIGPPPIILVQPIGVTVPINGTAIFTVVAVGINLSYQWYLDGDEVKKATSPILTVDKIKNGDGGEYTVKISNASGSVTSHVALLIIGNAPLTITTQPQSQTVIQGAAVTFSLAASGSGNLNYQWYFNGTAVAGPVGKTSSLALNNVGMAQAGSYSVVVNDSNGSLTSSVAALTLIASQPQNQTVLAGQNAAFSISVYSPLTLNYQWYFNESLMEGATNPSLTLTNVQSAAAGNYLVVLFGDNGAVTSAVATLTVKIPPTIITPPQSQIVTQGQNVTFTVAASGSGALKYQWYFNATPVTGPAGTGQNLFLKNVTANNNGNYAVVVTDDNGSTTSSVVTLTVVIVPPTITSQPQSQTNSPGQNISFSVAANGSGPLKYQWYFNAVAIGGPPGSGPTLTLNNITTNSAGNYTVTIQDNNGWATSSIATLTILVSPPTILGQPQSQTILIGQNASLTVSTTGSTPLTYQWYFNNAKIIGSQGSSPALAFNNITTNDAGNYWVTINNNYGAVTSSVAGLAIVKTLSYPVAECSMTPDGFQIQLTNVTTACVIYASTNLVTWTPIATNSAASGTVTYTDTSASQRPGRYYRVMNQ